MLSYEKGQVCYWFNEQEYKYDKKLEGYFGFKLRTALKEEPWILVARLPREQVASKGGIKDMLDILDQKYELVMEQ